MGSPRLTNIAGCEILATLQSILPRVELACEAKDAPILKKYKETTANNYLNCECQAEYYSMPCMHRPNYA